VSLGPLYTEAALERLPAADPLSARDVVKVLDASEQFTVHRIATIRTLAPIFVSVCSPRAPDGVVFQAQHSSGAVATLFVWGYDDPSVILEDWIEVDDALLPGPLRPISAYEPGLSAADVPRPDQPGSAASDAEGDEDGDEEPPAEEDLPCTTTLRVASGMLASTRYENLVVVLTGASPHPGAIYTSAGANDALLAIVRTLEVAP
jgi:hypothetical protein